MTQMSDRIVVYAGTRNIYHDMVVSAKSLLHHHGADRIYFLIEDDQFPEELPSCIICVPVQRQEFFPPYGPNFRCMWTYMVMMRTALTKIFPKHDRILTLDHDTIVYKPIDFLWDVDLTGYYYAAVEEKQIRNRQHPYFNCGVLLHNLSALRDGTDDTIIRSVNTQHFQYCEQDAINSVCKYRILELPAYYNVMHFNIPKIPDEQVIIRHHAARQKPLNAFEDYQHYDAMSWEDILGPRVVIPDA